MAAKKQGHLPDCLDCKETRNVIPSALLAGAVLLILIIVGLTALRPYLSKPSSKSLSSQQKDALPSMPGKGFFTLFGVVTDISNNVITIRSVSPIGNTSNEVFYQIGFDNSTVTTYQKPSSGQSSTLFSKESGRIADIHKGYFLSITTNDIISNVGVLRAVTIDYSESSPFINISNKK